MNNQIALFNVADYSNDRVNGSKLSIDNFVTTDSMLQGKNGITHASGLPKGNLIAFKECDILIGNIRPYLKKIWYSDKNGGSSPDVLVIRSKNGIDAKFLFYSLFRDDFFIHMMNGSKGTKMPRGDKRQILRFQIPDIEIIEQQKIASILSSIDSKIKLNNHINAELESMAKMLYDYWFVQFDFPNNDGKPYRRSGGKMVWNEELNREIPGEWNVKTFGDYCPSTGGFAFKSSWWTNNGVSVAKIKDIQENYTLNTSDLAKVDLSDKNIESKFRAKAGDVLIAMTGATIGKYAIVPLTDYPIYVNQRVGYFNLGDKPTSKLPFLINSLNQSYFRQSVFTLANGAAQPNISNEQINKIPLLIPESSYLNKFNQTLKEQYDKILSNQFENQKLVELRDWLLPMLMNGQVKVN